MGEPGHAVASITPKSARLTLVFLSALLLFVCLGCLDFWAPDEPRYAAIADEIVKGRNGWEGLVLMHINGEPYTQKPPLLYWLSALFSVPFGHVTAVSHRLPSALAAFGLVLLLYRWIGRERGPAYGLFAGLLLVTTFEFFFLARRGILDVLLALFETLALYSFWLAWTGRWRRREAVLGFHGAVALAMLTKGPVGWIVPALIVSAFSLWRRRKDMLWIPFSPWGLVIAGLPVLVWIAGSVALAGEGFFQEAVVENLLTRFTEGQSHTNPFYYYLYTFPAIALPWSLLWIALPRTWRLDRDDPDRPAHADDLWRFLGVWVVVSVVFFSLSSEKRELYLVSALPAAAALSAFALLCLTRHPIPFFTRAGALLGWLVVVLPALAALFLLVQPEIEGVRFALSSPFGLLCVSVVAAAIRWRAVRVPGPGLDRALSGIACLALVYLGVLIFVALPIDQAKSLRPLSTFAAVQAPDPGTPIALFGSRGSLGGLLIYSGHPVMEIETRDDLVRFRDRGGDIVVLKTRDLPKFEPLGSVQPLKTFREGRREVIVGRIADKP